MPLFTYHAIGSEGRKKDGEIEARSRNEVFRRLEQEGLQLVSLTQQDIKATILPEERKSRKVIFAGEKIHLTRSQIIIFTEELSDLLEAGLQLEPALRAMERRNELGGLKALVISVREKVVEGISFSTALRSVSDSFGELYCNLVSAGEISGSLPNILRKQSDYLKTLDELQNRVIQSLIYP